MPRKVKTTPPRAKKQLKRPGRPTDKGKASTRKPRTRAEKIVKGTGPGVKLQPHLQRALIPDRRRGTQRPVTLLSKNKVEPNKPIRNQAKPARLGSKTGLKGPQADFAAPIVRAAPRGVMDFRQLTVNTPNNQVPDEFGVTNQGRFPMQNISPTPGGKHSGRTGPIR